jgi:hypothetical protein
MDYLTDPQRRDCFEDARNSVAVDTVGDSVAGLALVATGDIAVTAGDAGTRDRRDSSASSRRAA